MNYRLIKTINGFENYNLTEIWADSLPGLDTGRIHWAYEKNPAGNAKLYLLEDTDRKFIFGVCAVIPRKFLVNGVTKIGGITADFAVCKEYRILGPALALQREITKSADFDFLIGIPNLNSYKIQMRAGYRNLSNMTRYFKLFRSKHILKRRYKDSVKKFIWPFVDIYYQWSSIMINSKLGKYLDTVPSFDKEFDGLQRDASISFMGERSLNYLDWRFCQNPYQDYIILKFKRPEENYISGYAVYHLKDNMAYVDDFMCAKHQDDLKTLLDALTVHAFTNKFDGVSILANGNYRYASIFNASGFFRMQTKMKAVFYDSSTKPINLQYPFLSGGDFDIDIS